MNHFNFTELMCKVDTFNDLNTKQLLLYEARAIYEQTVLYADDYLKQVESALIYFQKVNELSPPMEEVRPKSNNLKIATCLVFELLNLAGKGKQINDLTTLSWLASIITGFSKDHILNTVQKGFYFSKRHHGIIIQEVNDVLQRLQMPFVIDITKKN